MATDFPAALDTIKLTNPNTTDKTNSPSLAGAQANQNDAIKAIEAKIGTGASTPVVSTLLFGTGTGTSAWTQLTSAQLAASLSDETGSGKAVFGTSPTLITPAVDTINESTPSNGVTVGGVNLKSGVITTANSVTDTAIATGGLKTNKFSNPYKFSAYRAAAANSGSSAFGLVTFDTKEFDTGSNYSTSTGQFTAPIAGYYQFNASLGATGTPTIWIIALFKNGSEFKRGTDTRTTGVQVGGTASGFIQLAATDTVDVRIFANTAIALNIGQATTHFSGFLVSTT